jgi:hypothetical protein
MAKSIFYLSSVLKNGKKSIFELSADLIDLMLKLAEIDPVFLSAIYRRNDINLDLKLTNGDRQNCILSLANIILESHKADIRQQDKVDAATIDFSRDFGFLLLFDFTKAGKQVFSITTRIGSSQDQYLKIEYFNREFEHDFNWYFFVLKALVEYFAPEHAGVVTSVPAFFDPFKKLKVWPPLGWISYFSNDGAIKIPDDLNGVEYEHTDKGKFIILTREDFTISKEVFETHRDKLLEIMKEIKSRVPEYTEK